jgi:hypothetical protein
MPFYTSPGVHILLSGLDEEKMSRQDLRTNRPRPARDVVIEEARR